MGTTMASVLDERLCKVIGEWLEFDVTTAIAASTALISSALLSYDDGNDSHFIGDFVYITEMNNIDVERKIYNYDSSSYTCSLRGGNLTAEASTANFATCRISSHGYVAHLRAINDAIREIGFDVLFHEIDDRTLVTDNILPDGHFENWPSSTTLQYYSVSGTATLTQTGTAGYYRGPRGTYSMLVTASASTQYAYIDSDTYPRLLDLMNTDIDIAVHAMPSETDDAFMDVVYTKAGASSTVSTTTTCSSVLFTKLYRDNISIPDDIEKIEFRFRVETNAKTAYFDNARVKGKTIHEYMLPETLQDGGVSQVYIQSSGYSDDPCDDLFPADWNRIFDFDITTDGTYRFLYLPASYSGNRQLRIIGISPLSELSAFTDTIEIDGAAIDLLSVYAAHCLFRNEEDIPSSEDTSRYISRGQRYLNEYYRLKPSLKMVKPRGTMRIPSI